MTATEAARLWETSEHDGVVIAEYRHAPANYFVDDAVAELDAVIRSLRGRADVRAVVLAGRVGEPFITHFDVKQILAGVRDPERTVAHGPTRNVAVGELFAALASLPVPVIAALTGDAMGFGFELALACDLRIGVRGDALYGLPELRLGIIPGAGGTQRLVRLIGFDRAFDIVVRGRVLDPDAALAAGLLTELSDDPRARAIDLAREVAALAPIAVAVAKRALHQGADAPLAAALALEADASVRAKLAPDARARLEGYVALPLAARREWLRA